jgi:hypothetical protein
MKIVLKTIVVVLACVIALVLYKPGLPMGSTMQRDDVKRSATLTCRSLHWYGVRVRDIDLTAEYRKGTLGNLRCYSWD